MKKTSSIVMFITLLTLCNCSSNKYLGENADPETVKQTGNKVCRTVTAADLQKEFEKTKSKSLIINLYPLKASNNSQKKDFSLYVQFQDGKDTSRVGANKASEKLILNGTQNYIRFLKNNKIDKNSIPFGYYVQIGQQQLGSKLDLCMNVGASTVVTFDKPLSTTVYESRDSCKCPPTCPCPPETIFLMYSSSVKRVIEKVYAVPR